MRKNYVAISISEKPFEHMGVQYNDRVLPDNTNADQLKLLTNEGCIFIEAHGCLDDKSDRDFSYVDSRKPFPMKNLVEFLATHLDSSKINNPNSSTKLKIDLVICFAAYQSQGDLFKSQAAYLSKLLAEKNIFCEVVATVSINSILYNIMTQSSPSIAILYSSNYSPASYHILSIEKCMSQLNDLKGTDEKSLAKKRELHNYIQDVTSADRIQKSKEVVGTRYRFLSEPGQDKPIIYEDNWYKKTNLIRKKLFKYFSDLQALLSELKITSSMSGELSKIESAIQDLNKTIALVGEKQKFMHQVAQNLTMVVDDLNQTLQVAESINLFADSSTLQTIKQSSFYFSGLFSTISSKLGYQENSKKFAVDNVKASIKNLIPKMITHLLNLEKPNYHAYLGLV